MQLRASEQKYNERMDSNYQIVQENQALHSKLRNAHKEIEVLRLSVGTLTEAVTKVRFDEGHKSGSEAEAILMQGEVLRARQLHNITVDGLQAENSTLEMQLQQSDQRRQEAEVRAAAATVELKTVRGDLFVVSERARALELSLAQLGLAYQNTVTQLRAVESDGAAVKAHHMQCGDWEMLLVQTLGKLREAVAEGKRLTEAQQASQQAFNQLTESHGKCGGQIESLQGQLQLEGHKRAELTKKLHQLHVDTAEANAKLKELKAEHSKVEMEMEDAKEELATEQAAHRQVCT
jgi:chromosome segregation ATPase